MDLATATNATCQISPHAHVVRAVLSAFVGSTVGGLTGGFGVAYYSAFMTWTLGLDIICVGLGFLLRCFVEVEDDDEERHLGCIGWIGWTYSAIYSPISQILWVAGNFHSASVELKAVQAFAIGTSTLSLTANPHIRRGGIRLKNSIGVAFNAITGISLLTLGVFPWVLFISAWRDNPHPRGAVAILFLLLMQPITSVMVVVVRLITWLGPGDLSLPTILKRILHIFGIVCIAAIATVPAFAIMWTAPTSPGMGLKDYLQCEGLALWRKIIAITP